MRDDEILAPLNFAKIWAHHRHLARAIELHPQFFAPATITRPEPRQHGGA